MMKNHKKEMMCTKKINTEFRLTIRRSTLRGFNQVDKQIVPEKKEIYNFTNS